MRRGLLSRALHARACTALASELCETTHEQLLDVTSRDVVESVEGCAANRRVVSVVVVEVEPAGQRQASFCF